MSQCPAGAYNSTMTSTMYASDVFALETMDVPGGSETVLRGGRHLFPLLPRAFAGVRRIGVLGWGPQGRAQALNLRDSLAGTDIRVAVGLRPGSGSAADARAHGFTEEDGTLGDWLAVAADSDLVVLLIADAAPSPPTTRRSSRC
ncbi:hypothetical protein M2163_002032 [Streptomyces sp. SAI-135]|nr:hypothetical protein [Streptomyces sp. SAI-135]